MKQKPNPKCVRAHQCPHRACMAKSLIEKKRNEKKRQIEQQLAVATLVDHPTPSRKEKRL